MIRRAALWCALLLASAPASAGWWDVYLADAHFDLATARERALAVVAEEPKSAAAVGAALWWLNRLDSLPDPDAYSNSAPYLTGL